MSLPIALTPGTVIANNYVIGSLINSGGFGAVYRATDSSEGNRPCAIKETYDVTPAARRQALMEASVLFTVRSEHLPQVYDALEANGRFYLVMQLVEGQDLLHLLKERVAQHHMAPVGEQEPHQMLQGPCSEQEVLAWMLPFMDVLQELHSRHPAVVHRDIKPANIILTPHQTTVLVDFGLTKLYDAHSNGTQTLVRAVSQGFSPIEQYTGKTGPQSDIYALAATMYLLLTNCLPPSAVKRSVHDELIAPRQFNPTLSLKVEHALLKALAVQADLRYQTMHEFAQALRAPAFDAHADPTLVGLKAPSLRYPQAPLTIQKQPVPAYARVPQKPMNKSTSVPPKAYPVLPVAPAVPTVPPGFVMVPQSANTSAQSLPTPFGQGCLFGLIQAVLSALLVLFLKEESSFYLALCMGFFFYALAGFMTTRRGGSSLRGGWSGVWAGVTSTVMFWVILFIGLFILLAQRIEVDTTKAQESGTPLPHNELNRAWHATQPMYPHYSFASTQSSWLNLLFLLGGGILLASAIGWLGGMLGTSQHQKKSAKMQHRVP
ncbi:MAG: hypothetical protein NVS4B12_02440 [Ktedonobacteraceae bacterium]